MRRTFSTSQVVTLLSECEAATVRDFLCHLGSSPMGSALTNYYEAESELESEKSLAVLDKMMTVTEKVTAQREEELEAQEATAVAEPATTAVAEPAWTAEPKDFHIVRD